MLHLQSEYMPPTLKLPLAALVFNLSCTFTKKQTQAPAKRTHRKSEIVINRWGRRTENLQ